MYTMEYNSDQLGLLGLGLLPDETSAKVISFRFGIKKKTTTKLQTISKTVRAKPRLCTAYCVKPLTRLTKSKRSH